jgi:hypothetical protein
MSNLNHLRANLSNTWLFIVNKKNFNVASLEIDSIICNPHIIGAFLNLICSLKLNMSMIEEICGNDISINSHHQFITIYKAPPIDINEDFVSACK